MKILVIIRNMKNISVNISKKLLTLFILATFLVIPFVDSIACDDSISASDGKVVDARCICPIHLNTIGDVSSYDNSPIFEPALSVHKTKSIAFLEPVFSINKPPQN
ncbi:MAG: hypothetical protein M0Z70_10365 [Nitrospiraceae bacterium]|nr:hypothetical protein [Nitrospiraceae bacterium]